MHNQCNMVLSNVELLSAYVFVIEIADVINLGCYAASICLQLMCALHIRYIKNDLFIRSELHVA